MLPAITTTHAIPRLILSTRITVRTTVVCQYCFETLGSASDLKERRSIELKHKCREKLLAEQPAISLPFS
jgi:hypothetical protein